MRRCDAPPIENSGREATGAWLPADEARREAGSLGVWPEHILYDGDVELPVTAQDLVAGRYRVGRVIARGGMSTVYEAVHVITGRRIALKLTSADAEDAAELRARMRLEAAALGAVHHRNVVAIHDAGLLDDGRSFVALELLEGKPLDAILTARGTLGVVESAWIGVEVAAALAAAHDREIAHRDVKPSNILVVRSKDGGDAVKLIDFGIAARFASGEPSALGRVTKIEEVIGTPEYLSPERLEKVGPDDGRSDVYALAVTLYELLTGEVPFPGSYKQVLFAMATRAVPAIQRADVPPGLCAAISRGLARDPDARFPTMRAFLGALAPFAIGARASLLPSVGSDLDSIDVEMLEESVRPPPLPNARRRSGRAAFIAPVSITHENGTAIGQSEDLSEGGMLVVVAHAFPNDVDAVVRFVPPGLGQEVEVRAAVRWARAARRGTAFGVEFIDPSPELRAAIARWVIRPSS